MKPSEGHTEVICKTEKKLKPVSEFSITRTGHYQTDCKDCRNAKARKKFAERHKEVYVQRK